jgi:hypothetical protein
MAATLSIWSLAAIPVRILPAAPVSPLVILKHGTLPLAQTVAVFGWDIMSALGRRKYNVYHGYYNNYIYIYIHVYWQWCDYTDTIRDWNGGRLRRLSLSC